MVDRGASADVACLKDLVSLPAPVFSRASGLCNKGGHCAHRLCAIHVVRQFPCKLQCVVQKLYNVCGAYVSAVLTFDF